MAGGFGLFLAVLFLVIKSVPALAAPPSAEPQAIYRLLMLVEYIGSDYARAVENGTVISVPEYGEMQEFSRALEMQVRQAAPAQPSSGIRARWRNG